VFPAYVHNNLLASQRLFEAATALGVRTLFASSSSVYGDAEALPVTESTPLEPISPYGVTKLACERLAAAYTAQGLEAVVLRYFTVYGVRQRPDMAVARLTAAACDETTFVLNGTGEQSRDFTYVDDAVEATLTAMERAPAGAVYNVGGGEEASMNELVRLLGELCGRPLDVRLGAPLPGDVKRTAADCGRIRRELGWRPRATLRTGLAAQLERRVVTGALPSSRGRGLPVNGEPHADSGRRGVETGAGGGAQP
jgi:nucleoside-diphosphate-sugar epimerase